MIQKCDEKLKINITIGSRGKPEYASGANFLDNTLLKSFATALEYLRDCHFKENQNFLRAKILGNRCLPYTPFTPIEANLFPEP